MKRRNIKTTLSLSLSAVFALLTLAGCGSSSSGSGSSNSPSGGSSKKETVTVQWWTPNWDEPESREMAAEFEAQNENIKVELVITDWDTYKSKISAAISASNAPELSTVLTTDIPQFAKLGLAAELDDYAKTEGIAMDDFIPAALDITTVDGKVYGLPFRHDGSGMYYNVDLLKEAGYETFPETWDEFVTMAKGLTKGEVTGFAWPLGNQANAVTRLVQQLYSNGGEIFNEDETACTLNSDAAKKALNNIVSSVKEGYASPNSLEWDNTKMRDAFGSGKLAVLFSGPFDTDTLLADYPDLNFKTAVIPGVDGMGYTTANGWSIMLADKSKNKDAAAKLLAYLIKPENQIRLTDSFPASKTVLTDPKFSTEYLTPFAKQLDHSLAEPAHEQWAVFEPIIFSYIQQAVAGTITVDQACDQMTAEINALLG